MENYFISETTKETPGTQIELHLKPIDELDSQDFIEYWKITEIIKKYSDFIRLPY